MWKIEDIKQSCGGNILFVQIRSEHLQKGGI